MRREGVPDGELRAVVDGGPAQHGGDVWAGRAEAEHDRVAAGASAVGVCVWRERQVARGEFVGGDPAPSAWDAERAVAAGVGGGGCVGL